MDAPRRVRAATVSSRFRRTGLSDRMTLPDSWRTTPHYGRNGMYFEIAARRARCIGVAGSKPVDGCARYPARPRGRQPAMTRDSGRGEVIEAPLPSLMVSVTTLADQETWAPTVT